MAAILSAYFIVSIGVIVWRGMREISKSLMAIGRTSMTMKKIPQITTTAQTSPSSVAY